MGALTVWQFDGASGADAPAATLEELQLRDEIRVWDALLISWPLDEPSPRTRPLRRVVGPGALGQSFWGFVYGLVFCTPLLGIAGPAQATHAEVGLDDGFVRAVRARVVSGTSAIALVSTDATVATLADRWGPRAQLVHTHVAVHRASVPVPAVSIAD